MTKWKIDKVEMECRELIERIMALREDTVNIYNGHRWIQAGKLTSAIKRQSMELTRALSDMRR